MQYEKVPLSIIHDVRFKKGIELFNSADWYLAHDIFEDLWHETLGPSRQFVQAIVQIAVAEVHLQNGNKNGATLLYGEAFGRLNKVNTSELDLDINQLKNCIKQRLGYLQSDKNIGDCKIPYLSKK
tara:strand:+ start:409 stop:786 length:378 start_codon:yes stop_codon:yes gene_type:complete